jgi:hypothetical protein
MGLEMIWTLGQFNARLSAMILLGEGRHLRIQLLSIMITWLLLIFFGLGQPGAGPVEDRNQNDHQLQAGVGNQNNQQLQADNQNNHQL